MKSAEAKLRHLKKILLEMDGAVIAFSGGVDSTFLLKVAHEVLGSRVLAVTAQSPTLPKHELRCARDFVRRLGVRYRVIQTDELSDDCFIHNPPDRCYYCKKALFSNLLDIARKSRIPWVAEGSNRDDRKDYRPGMQAVRELGIRTPLMEADLYKDEIRLLSRKMKLTTWDKPSAACLSSRLPYGEEITREKLKQVEEAELFLLKFGLKQVRVRYHNKIARIEIVPEEIRMLLDDTIRSKIVKKLKRLGFDYVTLDLQGYRTGSMNELLNKS
jgi:uncharacterized protein